MIRQASQELEAPTEGSCARSGDVFNSDSTRRLLMLEGDGGWGLYWSLYPPEQRSELRDWVTHHLLPQQGQKQQQTVGDAATSESVIDPQLLFAAAKVLGDQVSVGLSPFGDVPGWEALAAIGAAYKAAAAAATAADEQGSTAVQLVGHVLHTLLLPLLPASEVLLDRLVGNISCWQHVKVSSWGECNL